MNGKNETKQLEYIKKSITGITLISLIVTIIVLIILAGITLNLTVGKNGVITMSIQARERQQQGEAREKIQTALFEYEMIKVDENNRKTMKDYLESLSIEIIYEDDDCCRVNIDGYLFEIDKETGEIVELGKLSKVRPKITNVEVEIAQDKHTAIIKVNITAENSIKVTIGGREATQENGIYHMTVGKNGNHRIIVTDEKIGTKETASVQINEIDALIVEYSAQGATNIPENQEKDYLYDLTLTDQKPEKEGYVFIGWSENENDTYTSQKLYAAGGTYKENRSIKLYAIWHDLNTLSVVFDPNGAPGTPTVQMKAEGTDITLQANPFVREGYTFVGWSLKDTNESYLYLNQSTYARDTNTILYASWIKTTEEPQEVETIHAESLLAAIRDNDKKDGYYQIEVNANGTNTETYKIQLVNVYDNITYEENPILGSDNLDGAMLVIKYHQDVTINSGITLTPYNRKRGMLVYAKGKLTNHGTISMSQKGASAAAQDVYLWKNKKTSTDNLGTGGTYEYVPKYGAVGADSSTTSGNTYQTVQPNVTNAKGNGRQTAGGASGGAGKIGQNVYASGGKGGQGTSYSGGGGRRWNSYQRCKTNSQKC